MTKDEELVRTHQLLHAVATIVRFTRGRNRQASEELIRVMRTHTIVLGSVERGGLRLDDRGRSRVHWVQ